MRHGNIYVFIVLCVIGVNIYGTHVMECCHASYSENDEASVLDMYDDVVDIGNVEKSISDITKEHDIHIDSSFEDIYRLLLARDVDKAVINCVEKLSSSLTGELMENRQLMAGLMILIVIAAIFNNYSSIMKFSYVGEQGFYITYLMTAGVLISSFTLIYDIAEESISLIRELMECMLPAFSMSLIMCSGITTSHMVNTMFIYMLSLMEKLLLYIIIPMIRIYFLIVLLNQIGGRDRFSKLAELIKQGCLFTLKTFITGILGVNVVKSMLIPMHDNIRYNMLQKGIAMIPGGSSFSGITGIVVGAGVMIKNCVGIAAVFILLIMGAIPIIKILLFYISYRILLAFTQPISDSRILAGIQGACDSTEVLLRAVATSMSMCILSIAIIVLSTNVIS